MGGVGGDQPHGWEGVQQHDASHFFCGVATKKEMLPSAFTERI